MELESGEKIVVIIRKHPLVFLLTLLSIGFGAALPLIVIAFLPQDTLRMIFVSSDANSAGTFLYYCWLLALWVLLFVYWTTYYLDVWVITDRRIVDIDQKTLFRREMITTRIEKIQDITVEVDGILPTMFGYGKLSILTAGQDPDFHIENAAHPYAAKEKILAAHMAASERHTGISPDSL